MAQDRTYDLVIRGAEVVDGHGELGVRDVAVREGIIVEVAPEIHARATGRDVDAAGLTLLPGIVDSHVHMVDIARGPAPGHRSPAHQRLARTGVTTAVEFFDFRTMLDQWPASSAGLTVLGLQGLPAYGDGTPAGRIRDDVASALTGGAIGVKLLGGHFPSTPEASATAIAAADEAGCYAAFHAGTTANGSNLHGMIEACELADGRPLHVAHTNAYLRGATADLAEENQTALRLLAKHPQVVSEAHLAPLNLCLGGVRDGAFTDHIVVNCLRLGGYEPDPRGLTVAFADGFAHALIEQDQTAVPVTGARALAEWENDPEHTSLCFPVNRRLSGFVQTCARRDGTGAIRYEGAGEFCVDAISSDGGYWRNVIVDHGLALVAFGALSITQFAAKTSLAPAAMFGLTGKGRIAEGADADVIGVDRDRRTVRFTVAAGSLIYDGETVTGTGGTVLTTARGVGALTERGIPHRVLDLSASEFRRRREA